MSSSPQTIGIIGLGAVGYLLTNEIVKSSHGYIVKVFGKTKARRQFQNLFTESPIKFCANLTEFFAYPYPDIIILAIPNPIDQTAKSLAKHLLASPHPTTIVALQNGVDTIVSLKKALYIKPANQATISLVRACMTNASSRNSYKSLQPAQYDPKKLFVGLASVNSPKQTKNVAQLFENIGFKQQVYPNYKDMEWSKLVCGNLTGLTTAVTFLPLSKAIYDKDLLKFEIEFFKERVSLCRSAKIKLHDLPGFNAGQISRWIRLWPTRLLIHFQPLIKKSNLSPRSNTMPSTAKKILAGKKTEVDYYLKPVISLGKKLNRPTPYASTLYHAISSFTNGNIDPNQLSLEERKELLHL